jgi:hypothetical protein
VPGSGDYRFGVAERLAGRAPELEDPEVLRWLGRYIGRMHACRGCRRPVCAPPHLDVRPMETRALVPARARSGPSSPTSGRPLGCPDRAARSTSAGRPSMATETRRLRCTATALPVTCCGPTPGPALRRPRRRRHRPGRAGPVDAAFGRSRPP